MTDKINSPNYTQIPNILLGKIAPGNRAEPGLMAKLEGSQLKVFLAVCRLTLGYHQETRRASLKMMKDLTGLSKQGVHAAANALEKMGLIERSLDGGVTLWKATVNSVDQYYGKPMVNSVDQMVNSVDQDGQLSRPPSKKETKKKLKNKNTHDYLTDLVNHTREQETIAAPDDFQKHFGYRDEFLSIYNRQTGETKLVPAIKDQITDLSQEPNADPAIWELSITETVKHWSGHSKLPPLGRMIEVYRLGGDYKKWIEQTYGKSNGQQTTSTTRDTNRSKDEILKLLKEREAHEDP